ncbi:hypothetical protein DF185_03345 [Marinifilum breve]|uniref:Uncharacterized protein n=1 Tax=Marinifilum breve TaxID=2184082 RepID=A0A2V4AG93_9BACT|nr:DNA-binding domain-containing protein [Marinifilum breve]PXY03134.1 hypothetical protein DF185_03345 [Marinifilum breve]
MTVKYALNPNKLKTGFKNSYLAKVQSRGSVDLDGIVDRICFPGSGITRSEAKGVLIELNHAIENSLKEGFTVNLPFVKIKPSIRGQFLNSSDYFHPQRHQLCFTTSPGKSLKDLPQNIKLQKTHKSPKRPSIRQLINKHTNEELKELKALRVVEINGVNFRFPKDDEQVGVYLQSKEEEVKLQMISNENASILMVLLPEDMPAGEARFRIVVRYQHHREVMSCYSLPFPTH